MNEREVGIRQARTEIGDVRLIVFLQAAAVRHGDHVLALQLIQGHCASETSESLDAVFYDGDIYGYSLAAERLSDSKFQIDFGWQAGPTTGDGGTWEVTFERQSVYEIKQSGIWIC
jgi:hypothetical protein